MKYFNEYCSNITELISLDLNSNFINDLGVKYICVSLSNITSLQFLRLDGIYIYIMIWVDNDCITDDGLKLLIQCLDYIPDLRELLIFQNNITEEGAELLVNALEILPKFESIVVLWVIN